MGTPTTIRSLCFLVFLGFAIALSSDKHDEKQHQMAAAVVVGTVFCDTCFHRQFTSASRLLSGAVVSVQCADPKTQATFRKEARTDRRGVFRLRLPPTIGRHVDRIESCSVTLIKSNQPFCSIVSSGTSTVLHLKSKGKRVDVFSAGFFTFKPMKQPEYCYQKPNVDAVKKLQPTFFFFPPLPLVPSPSIPGLPAPPVLPPVTPSPGLLPPLTPQPPGLLPPLTPQPQPPSLLPPIPLLPSPPPPPPAIPFLPPFLPPNPLFPGVPPALASENKKKP